MCLRQMKWFPLCLAHRYEAYPCPRSAKPAVILAHPRRQSLRPFFCRSKQDINRIARPASPVSHAGRYNTLHLASKAVCQRGGHAPLWKPPVLSACGHSPQSCARVPTPPKPKETAQTSPPPRADLRRFFVRPAGRDGRKNAGGKLRFRVAIFDKLGYNKFNPNRRLQHERSG